MKLVIILGALFALVVSIYGFPFQGRIIDGDYASIEEVPYQVALLNGGQQVCGGSIISEDWVLTAAHCVDGQIPNSMSVVVGTPEWAKGGSTHRVSRIIAHPLYNLDIFADYDFALLQVSEPIPIGSPTVQPVRLASSEASDGAMAVVSGWGSEYRISKLKKTSVPVVSREKCRQMNGEDSITDRMMCAGWTEGGRNTCYGDSGGPLVVDGEQVGIVSWAYGCANPYSPTVFANVADQRDWIREQCGV